MQNSFILSKLTHFKYYYPCHGKRRGSLESTTNSCLPTPTTIPPNHSIHHLQLEDVRRNREVHYGNESEQNHEDQEGKEAEDHGVLVDLKVEVEDHEDQAEVVGDREEDHEEADRVEAEAEVGDHDEEHQVAGVVEGVEGEGEDHDDDDDEDGHHSPCEG